jgi:3-oxoacyl-[acyl-carrier protein] reductase
VPTSAADHPVIAELAGARILVTGAGGGIGAAIARAFGRCGAVVGVHFNANAQGADAVIADIAASGGTAFALQADLSRRGAAAALVERFAADAGGLDILVNNAGGPELLRPVAELDDATFDHVFDLNARCVFEACRAAIPHLKRSGRPASIINVTSLSARIGSGPGASIYGASKAFVGAMSKTLARELAADRIRVNALSPGFVATPLHDKVSSPALVSNWISQIPMGRGGTPEDCAGIALFLASPGLSGFVTGQVIEVNGGQHMGG